MINYTNIYNKQIRQDIKFFISSLKLNEIYFYGFTINYPNYIDNKELLIQNLDLEKQKLIELLKEIDLIEFVYIAEEIHGNRQLIREQNNLLSSNIKSLILNSNHKTMFGMPHLHGIFGVRSIINYENNNNLLLNIIEFLRENFIDIKISYLDTEKDILKYWNYCIKENDFEKHIFINYSKFYNNLYSLFYDKLSFFHINKINCLQMRVLDGKHSSIKGLFKLNKNSDAYVILYNIYLYFEINNLKLDIMNNIYIKEKNSKYSWIFLDDIESFLKKNIINIFQELLKIFNFQLKNNNSTNLLIENITSVINLLKTGVIILPIIKLNQNVIEFKDGLYFVNYNYFFCFYDNKKLLNQVDINSYKFFNKYFRKLKNKIPEYWLSCIKEMIKSNKLLKEFCTNLGYYFNCNIEIMKDIKQKSIVIVGSSNTGKTTLITNPLVLYQGLQNIGLISDNFDNFMFEQIENKSIIICDDFKYAQNSRSTVLKILNNEPILLNKKNKSKKLFINNAPIIFIFNSEQNDSLLKDPAFKNRLLIYTFTKSLKLKQHDSDFKNKIIDELPNIIIYCNTLFFNKYVKNKRTDFRLECRKLLLENK